MVSLTGDMSPLHPDRNLALELVRATEAASIRAVPFIGRRRELATLAHGSRKLYVTVERVVEESLLESEASAACARQAFDHRPLAIRDDCTCRPRPVDWRS